MSVLITTPIAATAITTVPATGSGERSRVMASQAIAPQAARSSVALASRGVDRGPPQTPGVAGRWGEPGEPTGPPGEQQAHHVAGIVPGIGQQRERVGPQPAARLHDHEREIQPHAQGHRPIEAFRREPMRVSMPVPAGCMVPVVGWSVCHGVLE